MEDIYVVQGLCTPLLGENAAVAQKLVTRVNFFFCLDSINALKQETPKLFTALVNMKGEY